MLFAGRGRAAGHAKGQSRLLKIGVENGGNDRTEGFYRVKRSGSGERE